MAGGQISPSPIDFHRRPYNTLALPCERVIFTFIFFEKVNTEISEWLLNDVCIYTHTFNGPLSGTTQVSRYQKCKTNLDLTEARDSEWQWHQPGHMQVYTSLQTDNHTSTPPLCFLQTRCPSCRPTNSVKALKARELNTKYRN